MTPIEAAKQNIDLVSVVEGVGVELKKRQNIRLAGLLIMQGAADRRFSATFGNAL